MTKQRDQLAGAEKRHLTEAITPLLTTLADGQILPEMRAYLHMLYPDAASLFDYLPANGIVVFDDYPRAIENAAQMRLDDTNWWAEKLDKQQVLTTADFGWSLTDQARDIQQASLIFSPLQRGIGQLRQTSLTNVTLRPTQQFFGQMPLLKGEVTRWQKQNMTVIFLTNSDDRQVKLVQTLNDFGIKVNQVSVDGLATGRTQSATLPLSAGFELPMQKLVVLTEKELFQQVRKRAPKRQTLSNAERIKSYNELKPGDYVVHVNHGIGIYEGMQTIENRGVKQDYITIAYQKGDKLFIPVTQLDLVQKYVGAAEKAPRINKMGTLQMISWLCMRNVKLNKATLLHQMMRKCVVLKRRFLTLKHQTKFVRLKKLRLTWKSPAQWIDYWWVMLVLVKLKLPCGRRLKQLMRVNKWLCWYRQLFWHSNITTHSLTVLKEPI